MEGILKVTPERLIQTANELGESGRTISSLTSEMISIVNGLKNVWQGDASAAYSGKFLGLSDDIERINMIIQEHVNDLNDMAKEYQNAEILSMEESERLSSDVIA